MSNSKAEKTSAAAAAVPPANETEMHTAAGLCQKIETHLLALQDSVNAGGKDELALLGYHAGTAIGKLLQSEKTAELLGKQVNELHSALLSLTRASLAQELLSLSKEG